MSERNPKVKAIRMPPMMAAGTAIRQLPNWELLEILNDAISYRQKQLDRILKIQQKVRKAVALASQPPKGTEMQDEQESEEKVEGK